MIRLTWPWVVWSLTRSIGRLRLWRERCDGDGLCGRVNSRLAAVLTVAVLATVTRSSLAASFSWTGFASSDNWNAITGFPGTTNWITGGDTSQIPGSFDTVTFDSSTTGAINVILNGTRRIQSATFTGGAPITMMSPGQLLELATGDITASATANTHEIQSNVALLSTGTWNVSQFGGTPGLLVSGSISQSGGTFGISKTGTGTLILAGNNTFTGTTSISSGTLQIGNGGVTGSVLGNISNSGSLVFDRATALTYGGFISGSGSLTKNGGSTLVLTGNHSYGGGTTINSGTLQLGNGGTSGSISGNVVNNGSLVINRSNTYTLSGGISGSGSLTKQGGGTLTLIGTNTYGGGTTISGGGTLQIGNGGTTGSIVGNVSNFGSLVFSRADDIVFGGPITGGGSLTKAGSGMLTLFGSNSYSGPTTLAGGVLSIASDGNLGTSGDVHAEGGHLRVTGSHSTTRDFVLSDGLDIEVNPGVTYTLNGQITGSEPLSKSGGGTLVIGGSSPVAVDLGISAGTLQVGNGGTSGSITGNVFNTGGVLEFNRSDDIAYAGQISGAGSLEKSGAGRLTLSGANSYSGATSINGGTLAISQEANLGFSTEVNISNAALQVTGSHTTAREFNFAGVGSLEIDGGVDYTITGEVGGAGGLTKVGAGKLTLSGTNSYAGVTAINGGTLAISSDANLGAGGNVSIADAALQVGATHATSRDFSLAGSAVFDIDDPETYTISGVVGGGGMLVKEGAGTLALSGASSYFGGTNVNDGVLAASETEALGTGDLVINGASVSVAGSPVFGVPGISAPKNVVVNGGDFTTAASVDTTVGLQGMVSLTGGSVSTRRLNMMLGGQLVGSGDVNASILADAGSTIALDGSAALGDATAANGFYSNGDFTVASGTATLRDANAAVFDSAASIEIGDGVGGSATIVADNGLTLDFGANMTGFGTVDTPNDPLMPLVNNGDIAGNSAGEPITLEGYVKGVGTLDHVVITGTNAPGFSPATVYYGSVEYAGTLGVELGDVSAGSFDRIVHSGVAELGGELVVDLINGFSPAWGDAFEILTAAGGISGTFTTEQLPALGGGLVLDVVYSASAVSLVAVLPGDYNSDGAVDAADYVVWRKNDGTQQEYEAWQANFGAVAGSGAGSGALSDARAVPEPASWLIAVLAGCLVSCGAGTRGRAMTSPADSARWRGVRA